MIELRQSNKDLGMDEYEMLFSKLLINVNKDWTGFNIIRYYNGCYDGRCYYVDLIDANMENLYKTILFIVNKN